MTMTEVWAVLTTSGLDVALTLVATVGIAAFLYKRFKR